VPKVRRTNVPPALFQHLLKRIQERKISAEQLVLFATWLDSNPEVPEGRIDFAPRLWFRRRVFSISAWLEADRRRGHLHAESTPLR